MRRLLYLFILVGTTGAVMKIPITEEENDGVSAENPPPFIPHNYTEGDRLLLVQAVWRHGDRAPVMTYPTDEHQENTWPMGWGELTQMGMLQQFALGKVIRRRYMTGATPFLHPHYAAKNIYVRSTDVNRTLISAYSNMAGLFSDGDKGKDYPSSDRWPTGWTPVPVHTIDVETDPTGNVFAPCARAEQLDKALTKSSVYKRILKENKDFLEFLSEKTGMEITLPIVYLVNDVSHIEKIYNLSQPKWLTVEVSERLKNLTNLANLYTYGIGDPYCPELIRLRGGPMLRALVDRMKSKFSCEKNSEDFTWMRNLKYYAYSAHDTTVAALLTTLGDEQRVIHGGLPHYTASVLFELWDLADIGPAVKILFHSAFHHNYHVITHLTKGCPPNNEFCPLSTFEKRSAKFMPVNLKKECEPRKRNGRTGGLHYQWRYPQKS